MKRKTILIFVLAGFVWPGLTLRAQNKAPVAYPKGISDANRRVVFDSTAFNGEGLALPRWDNGYLVSHEVESYQAGKSNVRKYDASGQLVLEAAIWFPGSQRVLIYSATVAADGKLIAGGKAEKSDGSFAPFIALVDSAGHLTDVIQTLGFAPLNVCQAPDGTIWSFGTPGYNDQSEPNPGNTLRHYDFRKGELGSYLARSTFPRRPSPGVLSYIRCSSDGVVAYNTPTQQFIAMQYGDGAPHLYQAHSPPKLRLYGFAAANTGNVFGFFSRGGTGGLYFLALEESANSAQWIEVPGTVGEYTKAGVVVGLWGSDGDQLLVSRGDDPAGQLGLHWTTPLK